MHLANRLMRPTWVEIDLDVVADNVRQIRRVVGRGRKLIACIKANAYGHGAVAVSSVLLENGADMLAVGNLEEGVRLQKWGIKAPILVFANTLDDALPYYLQYDLIPTVYEIGTARRLSGLATGECTVYVKVETGLGRLGVAAEEAVGLVKSLLRLSKIRVGGIYTHFGPAAGAQDKSYVEWQFARFTRVLEELDRDGIHIPVQQAANSGAIVDLPHTYLNAVCPGAALYGMLRTSAPRVDVGFRSPFVALKSRVIQVQRLPAGSRVGDQVLDRPSLIAIVPVGHADGYASVHARGGQVLVRGQRVPVVGSISLEHTKVDVTDVSGVQVGDEVVLIGRQGNAEVTLAEAAARQGCVEREVLGGLTYRLPYVYLRRGEPVWLSWRFGEEELSGVGSGTVQGMRPA